MNGKAMEHQTCKHKNIGIQSHTHIHTHTHTHTHIYIYTYIDCAAYSGRQRLIGRREDDAVVHQRVPLDVFGLVAVLLVIETRPPLDVLLLRLQLHRLCANQKTQWAAIMGDQTRMRE